MSGVDEIFNRFNKRESRLTVINKEPCFEATEFRRKIDESIFKSIGELPSSEQIVLAKYFVQEEWHTWRNALTASHPRSQLPSHAHACVDDVYFELYNRLRLLAARVQLKGLGPRSPEPRLPNLNIPAVDTLGASPEDILRRVSELERDVAD